MLWQLGWGRMRTSRIVRNTKETQIELELELEGTGKYTGSTGIAFFDHMLDLFTRHGNFSLNLKFKGDLEVDSHHSVEDVGIVLGEAFKEALGDKNGIERYGHILLPMDEALIAVALDLSGRPYLDFKIELPYETIGNFETELVEEFMRAFAFSLGMNLHIRELEGRNTHHIIEGAFKGLARSLKQAIVISNNNGIPSTKGAL